MVQLARWEPRMMLREKASIKQAKREIHGGEMV
jgi:hypothetical protein